MAVIGADLLQPKGPVDLVLFPGQPSNVVTAMLQQYLDNAYADERVAAQTNGPTKDALAKSWALYLTFDGVYTRMIAEPITVTVAEKGGHGYSTEQIRGMAALRDKYLADFNNMLLTPGAVPPGQFPGSFSVNNRVIF